VQRLVEAIEAPNPLEAEYHKWYKLIGTPNTDECVADHDICGLVVNYACRAMAKGGVEIDDAREFESEFRQILDGPIGTCELCSKVRGQIRLNKKTKVLAGEVVLPCKSHGCMSWEFEIGEGVGEGAP
jgi:hypothetical protein